MALIDDLLNGSITDGLTEAGVSLILRLKASGSPTVGQDAWALSLMSKELPADWRSAIFGYLGYYDIDTYPLQRTKGEKIERSVLRSPRHDPYEDIEEQQPQPQPPVKRVRTSRTRPVAKDEAAAQSGGRITRDGKPDRRCVPRTNNPKGKQAKVLPWDQLEAMRWYHLPRAAGILGIHPRSLRRRVAAKNVPENIKIGGIPNICYMIQRISLE